MNSLSQNSCYLAVIRPPTKSVQHCTTGTCQIERVSFQSNHQNLQYSIKHSKVLKEYKKLYPYTMPFANEQYEEIFTAKNIHDDKSKFYVGKTLKELHCTLYSLNYIQGLKLQKYSSKNERHELQLLSIWRNLMPHQKLIDRCSEQWIKIGFQVKDPATDFRGAGTLGLLNLCKLTEKPFCQKLFKIASQPQTQYFFCSAGLFFTMLTCDLLKNRNINYQYWVHENENEILDKFQAIYEMLFKQFTKFWLQTCEDKSIMYFNQNLKNFEKKVKSWESKLLKAHIMDSLK